MVTEQDAIAKAANESALPLTTENRELVKLLALKSGLTNDLLNGHVRVPANKGGCA